MPKHLIVIAGPTASGKSHLAEILANSLKTEIISCDSRQIYREMNIGTAKPPIEVLKKLRHHFIDHISIHDDYSAGQFEREAMELIDRLFLDRTCLIAAGGSGLYIKSIVDGLDDFPDVNPEIRSKYQRLYERSGLAPLIAKLKKLDEVYYHTVDRQNPIRIIRALSIIEASGKPFSQFRIGKKKHRKFNIVPILLLPEREKLYRVINARVEKIMEEGLLEEAKSLYPSRHLSCLQTVGYQELFAHFEGKLELDQAVDLIKQNSRRYAKRQMTWFRKYGNWKIFDAGSHESILEYVFSKTGLNI